MRLPDSGEVGPTEDPIAIPLEDAAPYIARWVWESRESVNLKAEGVPDTRVDGEPISAAVGGVPTQPPGDVSRDGVLMPTSSSESCEAPEISHATASSVLPPEEEDPTLPHYATDGTKANHNPPSSPPSAPQAVHPSTYIPASAIPAVRSLDSDPLPPKKKRKVQEAPPVSPQNGATAGRTLRSTTKKAVEAPDCPSTSSVGAGPITTTLVEASSSNHEGNLTTQGRKGPKTRSATQTSVPARPGRARQTPKPSEKTKKSGRGAGTGKA